MRRIAAVMWAAAVCLLSACGASGGGTVKEGLYYDASGICPDAVLLTVNGEEVAAERYFYWLTYTCDYAAQAMGEGLDWNEERDGGTLAQYVKEEALQRTVTYAIVEQWAAQTGCTLTEEDRSAMEAQFQADAERCGGEEAYLAQIATMGLDREDADALTAVHYLYTHLEEIYPESDLCPGEGVTIDEALTEAVSEAEITYADTYDTIDAASYYGKVTVLRDNS